MAKKESAAVVAKLNITVYENNKVDVEVDVEDEYIMMSGIATVIMDENHPEIGRWFKTAVAVTAMDEMMYIEKMSKKK
jgi:hypothetical protein